jgi:hypothetical protein
MIAWKSGCTPPALRTLTADSESVNHSVNVVDLCRHYGVSF